MSQEPKQNIAIILPVDVMVQCPGCTHSLDADGPRNCWNLGDFISGTSGELIKEKSITCEECDMSVTVKNPFIGVLEDLMS